MRKFVGTILAVAALGALPALAAAAAPTIKVKPKDVSFGGKVTISGSAGGCPTGDTVTLTSRAFSGRHRFAGVPAVFATVASNGRYRTSAAIPAHRARGTYHVSGRCGGGNFGVQAKFKVV